MTWLSALRKRAHEAVHASAIEVVGPAGGPPNKRTALPTSRLLTPHRSPTTQMPPGDGGNSHASVHHRGLGRGRAATNCLQYQWSLLSFFCYISGCAICFVLNAPAGAIQGQRVKFSAGKVAPVSSLLKEGS
jgi:hypothetical protein